MSGNEIIDNQELRELKNIFTKSKGVLFAHGFDLRRNNIFRTNRRFQNMGASDLNKTPGMS